MLVVSTALRSNFLNAPLTTILARV